MDHQLHDERELESTIHYKGDICSRAECHFCVLMMSTQLSWSYRLDERFELTSTDVRMRCCHNRWLECCEVYPWQAQGGDNDEELEGSASGSGSGLGSGEMEPLYPDTEECKKYKRQYYGIHYGDRCVNSYVLFRDVRRTRNLVAQLYRCNVEKDEAFYKALLKVEEDMTPEGERCCRKHHSEEGIDYRVAYSAGKMIHDLEELEKDFKLHQSLPLFPCRLFGNTLTIEDKMSTAIWQMGLLIRCGKEVTCRL